MEKFSQKTVLILAGLMFLVTQSFGLPVKVNENENEELTIDEVLRRANENSDPKIASESIEPEVYLTEYDIALTKEQYEALHNTDPQKRTVGLRSESSRWTDKTVKYKLDPNFDADALKKIANAMAEISHFSCIKFRQYVESDTFRINILNSTGCWSYVGQVLSSQDLSLGKGCIYHGIIVHELLHALGLNHEQTHPDRDNYVTINFENIKPGKDVNFEMQSTTKVNTFGLPYDYRSVMHYGKTAFSSNGKNTITTKDSAYQDVIGNRKGMSFLDVRTLNAMYKCTTHCTKTDADCPNGFLGPDCRCWCSLPTDDYPIEYCSADDKTKYGSLKFVPS